MESFNDLEYLDRFIKKEIKKNFNVSFSGMFKRHRMKLPLISDHIILNRIASVARKCDKKFTDRQIIRALSYSRDYKEMVSGRKLWFRELCKVSRGRHS